MNSFSLNGKTVFNKENELFRGRMYFLQLGTSQLDNIYYINNSTGEYIPHENPLYIDNGNLPSDRLYLENKNYQISMDKYIGDYTDMSLDTRPEMWVHDRSWIEGSDSTGSGGSGNVLIGLTELKAHQPTVDGEVVSVIGYNNTFDCGLRSYQWVANSTANDDGGIVISSALSGNGRWLLISDHLSYIPSEYYGVYPGSINNLNSLLNYQLNVNNKSYPNTIKFARGHYTNPLTQITTSKNIMIDDLTEFDTVQFICNDISVETTRYNRTTPLGDFIPSKDCEIHTSWYKHTSKFPYCTEPKTLIVDGFYGMDDLPQDVYVVNDVIIGDISTVSTHLKPLHNVVLKKDTNYSIVTDDGIIAEHYSMTNNVAVVPVADGKVAIYGNNGNSAMSISEELVEIPNLSANGFSATSAYVNGLTATGGYFSNRCVSNMFDGISGRISNFETTAIGSEASAFIYFNHPWRTKAHDSAETWVTQVNDGIYGISTDHTNWKFNPVHFNTNYACPIINVAYPVTKDWGFTFYNEAEPGTVASEAPTGYPVCVVLANGKNSDGVWQFKKRVVYPGQHVYFHAVTTGSFKEELY